MSKEFHICLAWVFFSHQPLWFFFHVIHICAFSLLSHPDPLVLLNNSLINTSIHFSGLPAIALLSWRYTLPEMPTNTEQCLVLFGLHYFPYLSKRTVKYTINILTVHKQPSVCLTLTKTNMQKKPKRDILI